MQVSGVAKFDRASGLRARALVAGLALALSGAAALAQPQSSPEFQPHVGQDGKDVIWVPTAQTLVDRMMELAKVTPSDFVIDLGSGDGRTVITAAKIGAKALGVEYNPDMVTLSRRNAAAAGVAERATFVKADLFESDFSQATVVTMFLLSSINRKLRPKILDLKPGTRIVSNTFDMGEWKPDVTSVVSENCRAHCRAHFWLVPAKVEGKWKLGDSELSLNQKFQEFFGTLNVGGKDAPIAAGKLVGAKISFTTGGLDYEGVVDGDRMSGTLKRNGVEEKWSASRM